MDSSTHPWLSALRPNSRPSVITSLARPSNLSLLRDHQTTPPTTTPTTSNTTMIATASKALSQPGMAVLRNSSYATDSPGLTQMEKPEPASTLRICAYPCKSVADLFTSNAYRANQSPCCT